MSNVIYEASIYSREISYRNFKGEVITELLQFALDPMQLMEIIASFQPKKVKSGNPARNGQEIELRDEEQLKLVRNLAIKAAGRPSDDGNSWLPYEDFDNDLAGKAFLVKLASSDGDRREFSEKVILAPFRAFVEFTEADPTNTPADIQQFKQMLAQMENIFKMPDPKQETLEERRARLAAELAAMGDGPAEGTQNPQPLG
jgi:hypothetical protein